jgi:hypothetical protein
MTEQATPNELGTITVTCDDGDSWPVVLSNLDGFLVEIELRDGELRSGYSDVDRDGILLHSTRISPDGKLARWDDIRCLRVL